RDDLLGAFGDPKQTGKPFGSDIRSGKKTALVDEALARLRPSDRHAVGETLGRRDATDAQVKNVIALFERSGAREPVERRMNQLVKKALSSLEGAGLSKQGTNLLLGSAKALTARER